MKTFSLQFADTILTFSQPEWLKLAPGVVLILIGALLIQFYRSVSPEDDARFIPKGTRLGIASFLRALAFLCVVAALAGATLVQRQTQGHLEVVALVDGSTSMSEAQSEWIDSWLENLQENMRADDSLAVLRFAQGSALEAGPTSPTKLVRTRGSVEAGGTNLMGALRTATHLATHRGSGGVIVLLSDGNETQGDAARAAREARGRGVRIHPVIPPSDGSRLEIEEVRAPATVRSGDRVSLSLKIHNRHKDLQKAAIVVRHFDVELLRRPIEAPPGVSQFSTPIRAGRPGHYELTLELTATGKPGTQLARETASLSVLGRPRILFVSRRPILTSLLQDAGFEVERRRDLKDLTVDQLRPFHAVVLGEVSGLDLPLPTQRALSHYVHDLGGGLVLAAGAELLTDPALVDSPFEELLPVGIESQTPRARARQPFSLFLLIDRSSSMTYGVEAGTLRPTRIAYARQAALALLEQLEDRDHVGVAAFDTETSLLSPLKPLAENRSLLSDRIGRLMPSGGTDFKDALEMAARQLLAGDMSTKHIILITDGASIRPRSEHDALIGALADSDITVTSIRVGDDPDSYAVIKTLAEATGGGFYHVMDSTSLPDLLIRDTYQRTQRSDAATETKFRPHVRSARAEALGGLQTPELPFLSTFAPVSLKPGGEAWLGARHVSGSAPILAGWQNGLGRVAVFTADPSADWQSWDQVQRFWSQIIRWAARPQSSNEIRLTLERRQNQRWLRIDTFDREPEGELRVRFHDRTGQQMEVLAAELGRRRWEVEMPPLENIEPRIEVELIRNGERVLRRDEWLPVGGDVEWATRENQGQPANRKLLEQIAEISRGTLDSPIGDILRRPTENGEKKTPIAYWLATAALILTLLDIGVRWRPDR